MTDFFFPGNKCGIGDKVEKPVFKFVADCNIEPTPKPIFECPLPIVPREPDFPCPTFNVQTKLDVGFSPGDDPAIVGCPTKNFIKFDIQKHVNDSCLNPADANNCEFDVDLEVEIMFPRPPCPSIKITDFKVKSGFSNQPCVEDESKFEIRTKKIPGKDCLDPGSCEFEVDLSIVVPIPPIPCPDINVTTFSVISDYADVCTRGRNRFEIIPRHRPSEGCDDPGNCRFDVELEIYVPLPRPPCPEIKINDFRVTSGFDVADCSRPENKFEIRRTFRPAPCGDSGDQGDCDFEIDLQIHVPIPPIPCPDINITEFKVNTGYVGTPCSEGTNRFVITKREIPGGCDVPNKCEFDIALEIVVPIPLIPCPKINIKKFIVTSDYENCTSGQNRFVITTNHREPENCSDDAGECEFNIELEIDIPIPIPPCPEINVKIFDVKIGYPIRVCDDTPDKICSGQNRFVITSKKTDSECKDAQGNSKPPKCEFDVELEIFIPPPLIPCPEINIKKFKVGVGYMDSVCVDGESKISVERRIEPCTCDKPEKCIFDFEIEILVPVPRPKCPDIRICEFSVKTKYEGKSCYATESRVTENRGEGSIFKIVTVKKPFDPNVCLDDEPPCELQFWLDIEVPLPNPPCPEFEITTFKVTSGYEPCSTGDNVFKITKKDKKCLSCNPNDPCSECSFEFDLQIYVPIPVPPCPDIQTQLAVNYIAFNGLGPAPDLSDCNFFTVTKRRDNQCAKNDETSCTFDLDLQICIPIPQFPVPCPKLNVKTFKVDSKFNDCVLPPNKFTITPRNAPVVGPGGVIIWPQFCEFDFELEIYIPIPKMPCVQFVVNAPILTTFISGCRPQRPTTLTFTKNHLAGNCKKADECFFTVDLSIDVPIPKFVSWVTLTVKDPTINVDWCAGNAAATSKARIWFARLQDQFAGRCDVGAWQAFEMNFNLDIVLPAPPCRFFKLYAKQEKTPIQRVNLAEEYVKLSIEPKSSSGGYGCDPCEFEFDISIQLACPQCPIFHAEDNVKVYNDLTDPDAEPYGTLTFTPRAQYECDKPCEFDVYLELHLQKSCLPEFTYNSSRSQINACYYSDKATYESSCVNPPPVEVWIERTDDCKYEVYTYSKPSIYVPGETPCPVIWYSPGSFKVVPVDWYPMYESPEIEFRPDGYTDDGACKLELTGNIYVPKGCTPEFVVGGCEPNPCYYSDKATFETCGEPYVEVRIEKIDDKCKYKVSTYVKTPVYVPDLYCDEFKGDVNISYLSSPDAQPTGTITFTPQSLSDGVDHCTYDVKLDLNLRPSCKPTFSRGSQQVYITETSPQAAPSGSIEIDITDSGDCNYVVNATVNLILPRSTQICTGSVTVNGGDLGSGTLTCSDDTYMIDINLNTSSCPPNTYGLVMPPENWSPAVLESQMPPSMDEEPVNTLPADVIMSLWTDPTFVDGFVAALSTNSTLKKAIKDLLAD